jgi:hypothetical protein
MAKLKMAAISNEMFRPGILSDLFTELNLDLQGKINAKIKIVNKLQRVM